MNNVDLERFCNDRGCKYKNILYTKFQRKWLILLADGEPITAVYHFSSKTMRFEIGGLLNYSISSKHLFTQEIVSYFSDRKQSIARLDIAMDVAKTRDDLMVKVDDIKLKSYERICSSTYFNQKTSVLVVYDKSQHLGIFSKSLTRFELRFSSAQLRSWGVTDIMSNILSLNKLSKKMQKYFSDNVKIYSNDRLTQYSLNTDDVSLALMNCVAFFHGDQYRYKDHFKIRYALERRDRFLCWVKYHKLTPNTIEHFVKKMKKKNICDELSFDHKTLAKALEFFKGNPIFKN